MEQQRQREQATTAEDSKRAAQRQAIEQRRQEIARKAAEQKNAQTRTRAGAKNEVRDGSSLENGSLPAIHANDFLDGDQAA